MARTAVQPGKFVSNQGRQSANPRVVFAAVVGAMFLAGLPFISKEVSLKLSFAAHTLLAYE